MIKYKFINELKELLEKYKIDKINKIESIRMATAIYWLLFSLYDFNNEECSK